MAQEKSENYFSTKPGKVKKMLYGFPIQQTAQLLSSSLFTCSLGDGYADEFLYLLTNKTEFTDDLLLF